MTGQELALIVSKFANAMANKEQNNLFVQAIMREHRTLQQSIFRLFGKCIKEWAKSNHDLRNQATVETCKKIVEAVELDALPFI